jgi:hypothetical protein
MNWTSPPTGSGAVHFFRAALFNLKPFWTSLEPSRRAPLQIARNMSELYLTGTFKSKKLSLAENLQHGGGRFLGRLSHLSDKTARNTPIQVAQCAEVVVRCTSLLPAQAVMSALRFERAFAIGASAYDVFRTREAHSAFVGRAAA